MPKYITEKNVPATSAEEELLICLAEEASEVIKEVCKVQRSGLEHSPPNGISNRTRLAIEIGDFLAILEVLVEKGVLSRDRIGLAKGDKFHRLEFFLLHAEAL